MKNLAQKQAMMQVALLVAAVVAMAIFNPAFASEGGGGGLPYEGWLSSLRDSVTGPVAFTGATIGIAAAGLTLVFGGEISGFLKTIMYLILVMCLLIGVQNMLAFFGKGAEIVHAAHYLSARLG